MKKRLMKIMALSLCLGMAFPQSTFANANTEVLESVERADTESFSEENEKAEEVFAEEESPVAVEEEVIESYGATLTQIDLKPMEKGHKLLIIPIADKLNEVEAITYQYYDLQTGTWHTLEGNSQKMSYEWEIEKEGNYWIHVILHNPDGSESKLIAEYTASFEKTLLKVESIQIEETSPRNRLFSPVLETNQGLHELKYSYLLYDVDKKTWSELKPADRVDVYEWTSQRNGNYWVCLKVSAPDGTQAEKIESFQINNSLIQDIEVTPQKTLVLGKEARVTARVDNVYENNLTYRWLSYDGSVWREIKKGKDLDVIDWKPEKGANYWICLQLMDEKENLLDSKIVTYLVSDEYIKLSNLKADIGEETKLDITTESNGEEVSYRWIGYDLSKQVWFEIKPWSKESKAVWNPKAPGDYWMRAEVKTKSGIEANETKAISIGGGEVKAILASKASPMITGSEVEFKGEVNNPLNLKLKYQYMVYDQKSWSLLSSSDKISPLKWKPATAGSYWICFQTIGENGKVNQKITEYKVEDLYTKINGINVYSPDQRTFYLGANISTNDTNHNYKFMVYDLSEKTWKLLYNGKNNNTSFKPQQSGRYWIRLEVTGSDKKVVDHTLDYQIGWTSITKFELKKSGAYLEEGKSVQLDGEVSQTVAENITYVISKFDGSSWTTLYAGNRPKDVSWTPEHKGYYLFTYQLLNKSGTLIDQKNIQVSASEFEKNGWYYEDGYKFYYRNNKRVTDLDGILPRQSSYLAKVNKTTCTVTIYASDGDAGYIIPVKVFACSVGLPQTPTPSGSFRTMAKYRWASLMGPSWGQYATRIVGGILFHSVAGTAPNPYAIHAGDYNMLGAPASHGCVRLNVRDAKWIYDNCSLGMRVEIYNSPDPGPFGKPGTIKIPFEQNWDPTDPAV